MPKLSELNGWADNAPGKRDGLDCCCSDFELKSSDLPKHDNSLGCYDSRTLTMLRELDEKEVISLLNSVQAEELREMQYSSHHDKQELAKAICARFGTSSPTDNPKWPDKRYHHATSNNAQYESDEDAQWNKARDACIAAFEEWRKK